MATSLTYFARGDSSSANNSAINSEGTNKTPVTELTFVSATGGDIVLDYNGGLPDTNTLLVIGGVSRPFTLEFSGTLSPQNKLTNVNGENLNYEPVTVITDSLTGQRYYFFHEDQTTAATMEALPNGALPVDAVDNTTNVLICFASGTRIATPFGPRLVEDLRVGEPVLDQDGRAQQIRWIGRRTLNAQDLAANPTLVPVRIRENTLGAGLPSEDLVVSPQHRIRLAGSEVELHFGHFEMLAPAISLIDGDGITRDETVDEVTYHHILLDSHALLWSNDLLSESFHPGERAVCAMDRAVRDELFMLFPALAGTVDSYGPSCLPTLKGFEARILQSDDTHPAMSEKVA